MHFGVFLRDLPPLHPGPDHEGVHGALDVVPRLAALQLLLLVCSRGVLGHYYTKYRQAEVVLYLD